MGLAFLSCILSPRLYRIYTRASLDTTNGQVYLGNIAEQCGDFAISYGLPVAVIYTMWQRKIQYLAYIAIFIASSYAIRAAGRRLSPTYLTFLRVLQRAREAPGTENMEALRKYDFQFSGWPVGFTATTLSKLAVEQDAGTNVSKMTPCWLLSWVVAHSFGIRLIYPGLLLTPMLRTYLEDARAKYVMQTRAVRTKILTADGTQLDTMVFDNRREESNPRGKILAICCEGNAGFYEIGMAGTPLNEGFSVLGWNHPGFGGSSGTPYPVNELNAAEAVFEYATKELGFQEKDIVLYGWSIGGFPAAYLASQHPSIKGLILDATFDDLLPLAIPRMPAFMSSLVRATIRYHVDLRVGKEIQGYKGPLRLIRRTEDEIIADPPASITANRGNYLLIDVMRQRYPSLMNHEGSEKALREWLSHSHVRDTSARVLASQAEVHIPDDLESLSGADKATLTIRIADKILTDFKSTHCSPLPGELFAMPWSNNTHKNSQ